MAKSFISSHIVSTNTCKHRRLNKTPKPITIDWKSIKWHWFFGEETSELKDIIILNCITLFLRGIWNVLYRFCNIGFFIICCLLTAYSLHTFWVHITDYFYANKNVHQAPDTECFFKLPTASHRKFSFWWLLDATPRRDLAAIINNRTSLVSSGLLWRGVVPLAVARAWAHSPRTQENANACYHKKGNMLNSVKE